MEGPVYTIDVAHPPRHPDRVEEELNDAVRRVRASGHVRILKVIHGYGSTGRGGSTATVARNWAFRHRARFRAIINGEEYTPFDATTQEMRTVVGSYGDPDLLHGNAGILIVWVQ